MEKKQLLNIQYLRTINQKFPFHQSTYQVLDNPFEVYLNNKFWKSQFAIKEQTELVLFKMLKVYQDQKLRKIINNIILQ
ncbi:unnamed protein product [Paramecium sonneborni]|uniref:Uncharacterized protein n=1 Tax=Paramecium sonneborni TaxID=65129 RepID=A0A8S1K020_9CILI|nr:unnamed protein product [Paramecium sonneborni]